MRILFFLAVFVLPSLTAGDHPFGPVPPSALPDIRVTRHDGQTIRLRDALSGRRTAIQFVFTNCRTACPLLGSLFQRVGKGLTAPDAQLVSISVDPVHDTPPQLAEWLSTFHATPNWSAWTVSPAYLPRLLKAFGEDSGPPSGHTLQVFIVDRTARYVARTVSLPTASAVLAELQSNQAPLEPEIQSLQTPAPANGQDIFDGRTPLRATSGKEPIAANAARCANCHGANRNGGAEGSTRVPALDRNILTGAHSRRGGPPSAYTLPSFCETLRTGVDPAGVQLSQIMPRFQIDTRSCATLWHFLMKPVE